MIGKKFGKWQVLSTENIPYKGLYCECLCECGKIKKVYYRNLTTGKSTSCGCYRKELMKSAFKTHGLTKHPLYDVWCGIKVRCYNKNSKSYFDYGKRGIKLCDEWLNDFESFYNWALNNGYKPKLTIERIDNNSDYKPENCTWIPKSNQNANQRNTIYVTFRGKRVRLAQLCIDKNLNYHKIWERTQKYNWSIEDAICK